MTMPERELRWCRSHRASARPEMPEATMTAIAAAVLFTIALILHFAKFSLGPLDESAFVIAGFILTALHLSGLGAMGRRFSRR